MVILWLLGCAPPSDDAVIEAAWTELDRKYALFEIKGIDWQEHRTPEGADLWERMQNMLAPLDDNHVQVLTPDHDFWTPGSLQDLERDSFHVDVIATRLPDTERVHPRVITGPADATTDYLWIGSLDKEISRIAVDFVHRSQADRMILDVRDQTGGYHRDLEPIASALGASTDVYTRLRRRADYETWEPWIERSLATDPDAFTGEVVLITNGWTVSGGENLVLAIGERATTIGQPTAGAFGARVWGDLPNGWLFAYTIEDVRDADDFSYESVGLMPDVPADTTLEDLQAGEDPILEAALALP